MADKEIERWITVKGAHVPLFKGESEDDVKSRLESFTGKQTEEKHTPTTEEKIYNELGIPVPKESSDNNVQKLQEISARSNELYKELEKEKIPDDDLIYNQCQRFFVICLQSIQTEVNR